MKNYEDNSTKVVKKKGRKHKKSLFNKSIKYTEKILLPMAVIFLTFQYFLLTNKLDKAQESISQASYPVPAERNMDGDKSISDYIAPDNLTQAVSETQSDRNSATIIEKTPIDLLEDQAVISSAFDKNADMTASMDYFMQESDKISKYFSSYKSKGDDAVLDESDANNFIKAQEAIADLIKKVADKSYSGDRDQLKVEFWQLYWNDKLSYDNSNFEYLVLKFGKQLNVNDANFANLSSISNKIQAELGRKSKNTFWVEDELNNLRIN